MVWATLDKSAGRAGIKSFVVERGTPGMTVTKCEDKLGIRASDTATIVFEDCRIPLDNILGSPEVQKTTEGFKGVMATFDATRPIVAASAIGVGRAALDFVKRGARGGRRRDPLRRGRAQADRARARLHGHGGQPAGGPPAHLARRVDDGPAACATTSRPRWRKAKAGLAVTQVTQKAVELLGPLGYSRKLLLEKWMRDAKINDIFEGTQQINMLIIARRILGYSSKELS